MAILVEGDREVVAQMMYGPSTPEFRNYVQQANQHFLGSLNHVGMEMAQVAQNTFTRMDESEAMRIARAAQRAVNVYYQEDVITNMRAISDLQEAPDAMVRWIMVHSQLQQLYQNNAIDGYGERYNNPYPNSIGWVNPDYAQVYNGWMEPVTETLTRVNEQGEEETHEETYDEWTYTLEDDTEVDILLDVEAAIIRSAHQLVDVALANKQDPTSYYDSPVNE